MTEVSPLVFVFGALRSGTTLFRLMLNSHEGVSNPGEVDFLFDFLAPDPAHPTGWRYDLEALRANRIFRAHGLDLPEGVQGVDLLGNFMEQFHARSPGVLTINVHRHARRIAELLPDARIIHLLRDPRDVARSSIGMGWAGVSYYGIDHWIRTERGWDEAVPLLASDRVLTLHYEGLMNDLEGELARVCAFLGVPFSSAMLDYHRHSSYGPPDPGVVQQWRRKATSREVALVEGKCGDLLAARGYRPNGAPARPGPAELAGLAIRNRTGRWRTNARRVGLLLYLTDKVARFVGSPALRARVRRRIDDRIALKLK